MAQYPTVGGDAGDWGTKLEAFEDVTRDRTTGKILKLAEKASAVTGSEGDRVIADIGYVNDSVKGSDGTITTSRTESYVQGVQKDVYTKYLNGTLTTTFTNVAHGVTAANIVNVNAILFRSASSVYVVKEVERGATSSSEYKVVYDSTNITITHGSDYNNQVYRIKIEYTI